MGYLLSLLHFSCCFLVACQEAEKEKRIKAIAWKHSNDYTEKSFSFCARQENVFDEVRKARETVEFKRLFKPVPPRPQIPPTKLTIDEFPVKTKTDISSTSRVKEQTTTILHTACKNSDIQEVTDILGPFHHPGSVFISFLNQQDKNGDTALHIACKNNDIETVKLLCKPFNAKNLMVSNKWGFTPLHIVCMHNYIEIAELLLSFADSNPNVQEYDCTTPLHSAVENGYSEIAELLLNNEKTDPNIRRGHTGVPAVAPW